MTPDIEKAANNMNREHLQNLLDTLERIYKGDITTKTVVWEDGKVKSTKIVTDPMLCLRAIKYHKMLKEELTKIEPQYGMDAG